METKKLANCPFPTCNGKAKLMNITHHPRIVFYIYCTKCGLNTANYEEEEKVLSLWNDGRLKK